MTKSYRCTGFFFPITRTRYLQALNLLRRECVSRWHQIRARSVTKVLYLEVMMGIDLCFVLGSLLATLPFKSEQDWRYCSTNGKFGGTRPWPHAAELYYQISSRIVSDIINLLSDFTSCLVVRQFYSSKFRLILHDKVNTVSLANINYLLLKVNTKQHNQYFISLTNKKSFTR